VAGALYVLGIGVVIAWNGDVGENGRWGWILAWPVAVIASLAISIREELK